MTQRRRRRPSPPHGHGRSLVGLTAALALCAGCGASARTITIDLTVGRETDAFSKAPAVTRVDVTATDGAGATSTVSSAPGGTFDLGDRTTDDLLSIDVTGFDSGGGARVRGRSLSGFVLGNVGSDVVPVFVQRKGEWARPPGDLGHTHVGGVAAAIGERFLVLTGGSAALSTSGAVATRAVAAFDLFGLDGATMSQLPSAADSLASLGTALIVVAGAAATRVDLSAESTEDLAAPSGLASFADVAGGATITGPDGSQYVIGATRAGTPTKAVLRIAADGGLTAASLTTARAGAAAAWVPDVGLVVAGGSDAAPGVEILSTGASAFASTAFPADATTGAALGPAGVAAFALVGGALGGKPAPTRTFALDCGGSCAGAAIDAASLPIATQRTAAYSLGGKRLVVVGDDAKAGATRAFVVDLGARTQAEVPLREPRSGATPVPTPNGTLGLVGGVHADGTPATTVEIFFPE